jgi:DNA-binding CsgD family transcriptional regulator
VDCFAAETLPIDEGLARILLAELTAPPGDARAAQRRLGRAGELFAGCGAPWLADRVGREQRRAGARRTRRPEQETGLSGREREIAELATRGLTNRQIAERLFLSPRTVETHLTRVFQKPGGEHPYRTGIPDGRGLGMSASAPRVRVMAGPPPACSP